MVTASGPADQRPCSQLSPILLCPSLCFPCVLYTVLSNLQMFVILPQSVCICILKKAMATNWLCSFRNCILHYIYTVDHAWLIKSLPCTLSQPQWTLCRTSSYAEMPTETLGHHLRLKKQLNPQGQMLSQ